jgi:HPt (histidine-containing phosphotransfer) domain-containing protein
MTQIPESLRLRYAANLRDQYEIARGLFEAEDSGASLTQLQAIAHKLAGTGAAFGYPELSRTAAALDLALGARPPSPGEALQFMEALRQAATSA